MAATSFIPLLALLAFGRNFHRIRDFYYIRNNATLAAPAALTSAPIATSFVPRSGLLYNLQPSTVSCLHHPVSTPFSPLVPYFLHFALSARARLLGSG